MEKKKQGRGTQNHLENALEEKEKDEQEKKIRERRPLRKGDKVKNIMKAFYGKNGGIERK